MPLASGMTMGLFSDMLEIPKNWKTTGPLIETRLLSKTLCKQDWVCVPEDMGVDRNNDAARRVEKVSGPCGEGAREHNKREVSCSFLHCARNSTNIVRSHLHRCGYARLTSCGQFRWKHAVCLWGQLWDGNLCMSCLIEAS